MLWSRRLNGVTGMQGWATLELPLIKGVAPTVSDQPFPKVDPAFDLAALLVEFEASFAPAFDSAAFDGLALFPMVPPFVWTLSVIKTKY